MSQVFQVTGELTDNRHVTLDEPLPLTRGKIRMVVEQLSNELKPDLPTFERLLRERQAERGHMPRTKEQIDAYLKAERASWEG